MFCTWLYLWTVIRYELCNWYDWNIPIGTYRYWPLGCGSREYSKRLLQLQLAVRSIATSKKLFEVYKNISVLLFHQVLHHAAVNAECTNPHLISTTRMRKFTATVMQVSCDSIGIQIWDRYPVIPGKIINAGSYLLQHYRNSMACTCKPAYIYHTYI